MNQTDASGFSVRANVQTMSNIVYPTIMLIGLVGNVMVIMVIVKKKDMLNSTNIFLANLAIADLIISLVWGPAQLIDVNSKTGFYAVSSVICSTVPFVRCITTNASALTTLAISYERYYVICQPLKAGYICTKSRAYKVCLLAWALAAISNSVYTSLSNYKRGKHDGTYYDPFCMKETDSDWTKTLHLTNVTLFFIIPVIILVVLFLKISSNLRHAVAPDVNTAAMRHRSHVVTMLVTVIICFFVFLLPSRILFSLAILAPDALPNLLGVEKNYYFTHFCSMLLYLHSAVNPILYNLMSERFRQGFKDIFCKMMPRFN